MAQAFLGIGSNIRPEENVVSALELLTEASGISLTGISTFYRTPALPNPEASPVLPTGLPTGLPRRKDPDFLNGVLAISTELAPPELGSVLSDVEDALGRARTHDRYAPRIMDLDLLVFLSDSASCAGPNPPTHPDVFSRGFVAFPLLELAPDLRLPDRGQPLSEVTALLDDLDGTPEPQFTARLRSRFL